MSKLIHLRTHFRPLTSIKNSLYPFIRSYRKSNMLRAIANNSVTVLDISADEMMNCNDDFASDYNYDRNYGINDSNEGSNEGETKMESVTEQCRPEIIDVNPFVDPLEMTQTMAAVHSLAPLAPIDINGWEDEEEMRECTVDFEIIERLRRLNELPPIPTERSGIYEFKGIKIILPQRLLTPATYKYHFTEEDDYIPDDTRICHFTPKEGVPVNKKPQPKDAEASN